MRPALDLFQNPADAGAEDAARDELHPGEERDRNEDRGAIPGRAPVDDTSPNTVAVEAQAQ